MASLNKVMLIGNSGRDADLRYTANGTAVADFSLAVNSRRRGVGGDWEDQTEWFNIVLFGNTAENVSQYITKGKQVFVEGRLQTRTWDDDQGVRHYRTEVIANTIQLLGGRGEGGGGGGGDWDRPGRRGAPARDVPSGGDDIDVDDLPFE